MAKRVGVIRQRTFNEAGVFEGKVYTPILTLFINIKETGSLFVQSNLCEYFLPVLYDIHIELKHVF